MKNIFFILILAITLFACKKETVTPVAKITYVKATAWPSIDQNQLPWDSTSSPDIFLKLLDANLQELPNDPFDDSVFVNAMNVVNRPLDIPFRIPNLEADYYFQLIDDDTNGDADDTMGNVSFNLNDYPVNSAVIFKTSNGISLEIGLAWE